MPRSSWTPRRVPALCAVRTNRSENSSPASVPFGEWSNPPQVQGPHGGANLFKAHISSAAPGKPNVPAWSSRDPPEGELRSNPTGADRRSARPERRWLFGGSEPRSNSCCPRGDMRSKGSGRTEQAPTSLLLRAVQPSADTRPTPATSHVRRAHDPTPTQVWHFENPFAGERSKPLPKRARTRPAPSDTRPVSTRGRTRSKATVRVQCLAQGSPLFVPKASLRRGERRAFRSRRAEAR